MITIDKDKYTFNDISKNMQSSLDEDAFDKELESTLKDGFKWEGSKDNMWINIRQNIDKGVPWWRRGRRLIAVCTIFILSFALYSGINLFYKSFNDLIDTDERQFVDSGQEAVQPGTDGQKSGAPEDGQSRLLPSQPGQQMPSGDTGDTDKYIDDEALLPNAPGRSHQPVEDYVDKKYSYSIELSSHEVKPQVKISINIKLAALTGPMHLSENPPRIRLWRLEDYSSDNPGSPIEENSIDTLANLSIKAGETVSASIDYSVPSKEDGYIMDLWFEVVEDGELIVYTGGITRLIVNNK